MVKKRSSKVLQFFANWWLLILLFIGFSILNTITLIQNIKSYDYTVETNAFFAPFEYYDNRQIVGVDVEIINRVAEKLDADIDIKNVEFGMIIDNVANGVIADAGAAGLTITPARAEKVDFSIPYYTSVQYVIFDPMNPPEIKNDYIVWDALSGKVIGTQTGSTGYLFTSDEIEEGVLKDTNTKLKGLDSHQIAADAIKAHIIDYAIADELAAKFIVEKNPGLAALPLYYSGESPDEADYPAEESYAIAVNKQRPELLEAFNEVLSEMLIPDEEGKTEMDKLILKYMGLFEEES
ncbi:amino acid ABC transporter substrate-binding protein [Candidatus Saccharibacteria bacterium]|nr:amino acid ABC transporter substrate-binding protein [Candidatus Saccharibacteria bacterium]